MRRGSLFLTVALGLALVLSVSSSALAESDFELPVSHFVLGVPGSPAGPTAATPLAVSAIKNPPNPICTQTWSDGAVHRTDCEGNSPDNETSIAIDPTDPRRVLAAANDYQLVIHGSYVYFTILTRAMLSTDGGSTWVTHPIRYPGYNATGDPSVAYDATGRAYSATLGFVFSQGVQGLTEPDILVATSANGGANWTTPTVVAHGTGGNASPTILNDKEMLTAWGDGNAIVTWTRYVFGPHFSYRGSPIFASVTHDGGATWSEGRAISGSAAFCEGAGFAGAHDCDQSYGSWPVVAADGSIYDYFLNTDPKSPDFDDQVLVVKIDPATGRRVAGPWRVSGLQDGANDLPINEDGRQTLQDSQFRFSAFGNIAADPTDAKHLAVTWTDAIHSPSLGKGDFLNGKQLDPYEVKTNTDVLVSESFDRGRTWSTPRAVGASTARDQFYSAAAFLGNGTLVVGMMDRSYDPSNHAYAYSLSSWGAGAWSTRNVSGALSDPTKDNRWFAITDDPAFPAASLFIGDYTTVATFGSVARPYWTDLRNQTTFGGVKGADQQVMTAAVRFST